jgi:hypothetical protein
MNQYEIELQRQQFNEFVSHFSSKVNHIFQDGSSDDITFGKSSENLKTNSNNPLDAAIFIQGDDNFYDIVSSYGAAEDIKGIALIKYASLDLLPYDLTELHKMRKDVFEEIGLGFKYQVDDHSFYKLSNNIIGIIFTLDKV